MSSTAWWIGGGALLAAWALTREAPGPGGTFDFAFEDARWLRPGQSLGGRAVVPEGLTGALPLLVWLHGNNSTTEMHRGLGGGAAGSNDLSRMEGVGTLPLVIAAPSQTKNAADASLWSGFDLDAFVEAVEKATGRHIDRSRVVLAGHSGAGCSQAGGLLSPLGAVEPRKVLNIDGCLNERYGQLFGELGARVPVEVYYQTKSWTRDPAGFARGLAGRGVFEEIKSMGAATGNPHEDVVPVALAKALSS